MITYSRVKRNNIKKDQLVRVTEGATKYFAIVHDVNDKEISLILPTATLPCIVKGIHETIEKVNYDN